MRRSIIGFGFAVMLSTALLAAAPAYGTPPTGTLVNPSVGGPGTIISDKNDGTDSRYRFLVRAAATASGAGVSSVRIQIQPHNASSFVTVGNATEVGSTDAWELFWNETASGIPAGTGQVRAVITDSNGETTFVPSATGIDVTFDSSQPTVRITTPADGANLAFSGGSANLQGTASGDVDQVQAFYSTDNATTGPSWQSCGSTQFSPNPGGTSSWTISCNVGSNAPSVTAVAVIPTSDVPVPGTPGSGDAERVTGSAVGPNSVVISPSTVSQSSGHCQLFTAEVLDTHGSVVSGANVVVTAQGPTDATYFATVSGKTSAFSSPSLANQSTQNSFETADSCNQANASTKAGGQPSAPGQSGAEGVQNTTTKTKQIDGTTDSHGLFTFAVVSSQTGVTSIQAWNDVNGNDKNDNPKNPGPQCPASGIGVVEPCATAALTFETPVASSVLLSPAQAKAATGKTATFKATVLDQHQNPMGGQTPSFSVASGPNAGQDLDGDSSTPNGYFGFCVTDGSGQCTKSYTDMAKTGGTDLVKAFLDTNGDQMPQPGEPQATGRQTWTTNATPTTLFIQPSGKTTIHHGQSVNIHGQLTSAAKSCVAGSVIVLSNARGSVLARFTVTPSSVKKLSNGRWAGAYHFARKPAHTEWDHTSYAGSASCGASRAPTKGAVEIQVT